MQLTSESFAVGQTFVSTSTRQRTDGLKERQVLLVRIISNDGWNAMWERVTPLWGEHVLHEITSGGCAVHAQALQIRNSRPSKDNNMQPTDEDFTLYCRTLTDAQLEEVLRKEWAAFEHRDYPSAVVAAAERGWTVKAGERQS